MILDIIAKLLKRRKMASKLGVRFDRSASFQLPDSIRLNGQMKKLHVPDEHGVKMAFIDLLLDDCYGCRALKNHGANINTILDIGGNVGLFGVAARNSFPNAKIHSYEPNIQLEQYLAIQGESAGFEYFMESVGLESGKISLELTDESVLTRSKQDSDGTIPQIAFSEAIARLGGEVDLLKIDCEGAEWEIFKDHESWRKVKNLSMEYHLFEPEHTESAVKEIIENLGFKISSFEAIENYGLLSATHD